MNDYTTKNIQNKCSDVTKFEKFDMFLLSRNVGLSNFMTVAEKVVYKVTFFL